MRQAIIVSYDLVDEPCTNLRIVFTSINLIIEHLHVHRDSLIAQCHVLEGKSILSMWTWPSSSTCGFLHNGALMRSVCRL